MEFIASSLPPPPARVLDVGCGEAELAGRLRAAGYEVTAIDIDPAYAAPGVHIADICTYEDEPFDAVIFQTSLHHVHSLDKAIGRASALLKPGGLLVVDEFAAERADDAIADRFYGRPGSLRRWHADHRGLHTGTAMVDAITRHFTIGTLTNVPYLYRYLEDDSVRDSESILGIQLTATGRTTPMAIVRTTRYKVVDSADLDEVLSRRAAVIDKVRAAYPGLTETRLARLDDGTYVDAWRWDTREHMDAAVAGAPGIPEAGAAFAITIDPAVESAEILDER